MNASMVSEPAATTSTVMRMAHAPASSAPRHVGLTQRSSKGTPKTYHSSPREIPGARRYGAREANMHWTLLCRFRVCPRSHQPNRTACIAPERLHGKLQGHRQPGGKGGSHELRIRVDLLIPLSLATREAARPSQHHTNPSFPPLRRRRRTPLAKPCGRIRSTRPLGLFWLYLAMVLLKALFWVNSDFLRGENPRSSIGQ
jgi:hypothetical protein